MYNQTQQSSQVCWFSTIYNFLTGETITATINGVSKVLVTGGTLLSDISLDGVPILETKYDLCSVGVGCPIKPGPYHVTVTQQVTELAPPGNYQSKNQAFDLQGNRLSCVMINFTVSG
jgi:predicted solute-binding protein